MDETEFWQIVDETRAAADGDPEDHADALVDRLAELDDPEAVLDFARHFETRFHRAHRWDVWAAADVMLGGADEEAFDFFRCWLIAQGRDVFEGALASPDDLADLVPAFDPETDGDAEDVGYAADEAYEQLTGLRLPELGLPPQEDAPEGDRPDFDDAEAMAADLPRLWARFG
ncbi:DUF4240 domain-containing protein [Actinacidiphila yeochonensis]|uniref:DUF4240 domain-containing protein n=1 Tax=Actinacidiphila yeochonensis TaxID=89050 RepID=UPI000562AC7F|nr:DUF4240 domain-containing protein [Actinacidiphila yeochonensis]